jgi:hypothetical protein
VTRATHITGDWAVVFLLCSLALDAGAQRLRLDAAGADPPPVGVAAALYAGLHFLIYVADQKWDLVVVALEIAKRFYLTIGFAALLMLRRSPSPRPTAGSGGCSATGSGCTGWSIRRPCWRSCTSSSSPRPMSARRRSPPACSPG